jgi:CTP-dependent riboflavin kinase
MSKKKKSIMDGYFDEPITTVEINPFVEDLRSNPNLSDDDCYSPLGEIVKKIRSEEAKNKTESKQSLNGVENEVTVSKQSPELGLNSVETESKQSLNGVENEVTVSKQSPELGLNSVETESKQSLNGVENLDSNLLIGREKQLLEFVVFECQRVGSLETEPLTVERFKETLNASTDAVKTAIKRLASKGFISRGFRKNGRSGWVQYQVPRSIYERVLYSKTVSNRSLNSVGSVSERRPEQGSKQGLNVPYSSSNYLNINTNTIAAEILSIPENLRRFGISVTNLQNLISSGKATQEVVERSLAALSFDVEHGKTGNLANILFGVLGTGREYISQKYSETLQKELDAELARIQQAEESQKKLAETKLQIQFREFLVKNPNFLEEVREKHKGFVKNQDLLEKMAFEEFRTGTLNV